MQKKAALLTIRKTFLPAFCFANHMKSSLLFHPIISLSHLPACYTLLKSCDPFSKQSGWPPIYICSCTTLLQLISASSVKQVFAATKRNSLFYAHGKHDIWKAVRFWKLVRKITTRHTSLSQVEEDRSESDSEHQTLLVKSPQVTFSFHYRVRFATKQEGLPHKYSQLHTKARLKSEQHY